MNDPRDIGERPDNDLVAVMYDLGLRGNVGRNHARFEGYAPPYGAILRGYDRAEHPWVHGRRPADLVERLRRWWPW
jgi:hypothetical protein